MIDGAIMAVELGLFLILLLKVWRVHTRREPEEGGFYAYRQERPRDASAKGRPRDGGPPHA
jgi:hypothetical protein